MEFVKFNKRIKLDYGILTKNPDEVSENDFKHYRKLIYMYYKDFWYLLRSTEDINFIYNYLIYADNEDDLYKRAEKLIYGFNVR